jgi:hypothetical protein
MNPRIRLLAEQIYGTQATEQEIKFAELIVAECVTVIKWTPDQFGSNDRIIENIKEHFGVE